MLDSVVKVNKSYYPQKVFKKCKYETKNTKMKDFINDDLDPSWSDN